MKLINTVLFVLMLLQLHSLQAQVSEEWVVRYNSPTDSTEDEVVNALAVDDAGNVYVAGGERRNSNFVYVIIKYDTFGDTLWVRRYTPNAIFHAKARGIAVDNIGNVYVTGNGVMVSTLGNDIFTLKYNSAGDFLWAQRFQFNGSEVPNTIALDDSQNVYVAGTSQLGSITGKNMVTVKYSSEGVEKWASIYDGPAGKLDEPYSMAADSSGQVYVTGSSWTGSNFLSSDYLTIKYTPTGDTAWVKIYDGPAGRQDQSYALALDNSGNVLVTGRSDQANLSSDYYTIKYDSNGDTVWTARFDGSVNEVAYALKVDDAGNVYITGASPISADLNADYVTIKYDPNGNQLWLSRYAGTQGFSDDATGLALDNAGNVFVTGRVSQISGTFWDYGTVKYNNDGEEQWVAIYDGPASENDEASNVFNSELLRGNSLIGIDNVGNVYVTGRSRGIGTGYDIATIKYSTLTALESISSNIPDGFKLAQNYPNPFNPGTVIGFQLATVSQTTLKVYDVLGKEVAVLVNDKLAAGEYEVTFDGSTLAGGMYFYRLTAGEFSNTKKLLLIK